MTKNVNLLDFNLQQMRQFCVAYGEKPFRAQQLMQWIHQVGLHDFSQMTNLGQSLRERLSNEVEIRLPELITSQESSDGTHKWLLKLDCGNSIETVFIPEKKTRHTVCLITSRVCVKL